jgi:retinol dehydrogenase-12
VNMNILVFLFRYLLPSQFFRTPPLPTTSFEGQTLVVTGANAGIGYEVVKHLIRLNASKIILAVRSVARGEAAVERLVKETNCDANRLEVWAFDLGSYKSIDQFVARAESLERLDAVIQNGGIAGGPGEIDGIEITTKVNLLGPLYFGYAILPKLRRSAEEKGTMGRLSFNGSDGMYVCDINAVNNLQGSVLDAMNDPATQKGPLALGYA